MAQDYIMIRSQSDIGIVALNRSVFTTIAKIAIDEEDSIVLNDGGSLFKYPISCKLVDNKMVLTISTRKQRESSSQERAWVAFFSFIISPDFLL